MALDLKRKIRLLYCVEATSGGIADYVKFHALALQHAGIEVTILCRSNYPHVQLNGVNIKKGLPVKPSGGPVFLRLIRYISDSRAISTELQRTVANGNFDYVLFDCFREYLSPFWVGPLRKARSTGPRFGVVSHDPVRDFVVGPAWWHRYSIREAYRFIDDVFVHDAGRIDFGGARPERISVYEIPHGSYGHPEPVRSRIEVRKELDFEEEDIVFLAFGQIRDGKNLDKFLKAMTGVSSKVKLLVAGRGDSSSQKPPSYYQDLARTLDLSDRCRWLIKYIRDEEITEIFDACDVVLLTYSKAFVSASGVLNIAVERRKPVLASGGEGPLRSAVQKHPIGRWLQDLNPENLINGISDISDNLDTFEFSSYLHEYSWERNAETVMQAIASGINED